MALQHQHLAGLKKRWDQLREDFDAEVWALVQQFARAVFGPADPDQPGAFGKLPADVRKLRGDRWPITEGDVVILRSRWLWLLADRLRKTQTLPASWTANETLRALEHVDLTRGAAKGCDRPGTQLRFFDVLTEDYAERTGTILHQALERWLEATTADTVRALHVAPGDFAAIRANLAAWVNQEVWTLLTEKAGREILTSPSQIRQAP